MSGVNDTVMPRGVFLAGQKTPGICSNQTDCSTNELCDTAVTQQFCACGANGVQSCQNYG